MAISRKAEATACIVVVNVVLTLAIIGVCRPHGGALNAQGQVKATQHRTQDIFKNVCTEPDKNRDHIPRPYLLRSLDPAVTAAVQQKNLSMLNNICAPNKYVWQAEFGLHMCVYPPEKDKWVSGAFLSGGIWERENIQVMLKHLRRGRRGVVVDVGANIGTFSLIAAMEGHTVFAFEAHPTTAEMLWRSIQMNNLTERIHLWQNGLSDAATTAKISVQQSFNQGGATVIGKRSAMDIELLQMDNLFNQIAGATEGENIRFLKMDVEGHEPRVLRGAKKVLDLLRPKMMMMEITPVASENIGCSAAQALYDLHQLGYKAERIGRGTVPHTTAGGILQWFTNQGLYPNHENGDFVLSSN